MIERFMKVSKTKFGYAVILSSLLFQLFTQWKKHNQNDNLILHLQFLNGLLQIYVSKHKLFLFDEY